MSKMKEKEPLLCRIFRIINYVGIHMVKMSESRKVAVIGIFVLLFSGFFVKKNVLLGMLLFMIFYLILFIILSKQILLSLRGFIISGVIYWFGITGLFIMCIWYSTGINSIWLGYIVTFLSWCFYSLLANNKVASAANQIHSTILALIVIMKDAIIYSIPESFLNEMTASGDTYERIIEMSFGAIFYPFLAINLVALLLCNLKGYWIEKYNHNQDISLYEDDNRCE